MAEEKMDLIIPASFVEKWQGIVDTVAQLINVPAGLIMRLVNENIEVFVSSRTDGNPYKKGDREVFANSGLYCETVIKTNRKLHIPNALTDKHWKNNPDVKLHMVSYLGLPILNPDETPFGTICVLDNTENHYSDLFIKIMYNFRELIENDLKILYMDQALGEENKRLVDFIKEYKQLKGLLRICANCKKIRDENEEWVEIEQYIETHSEAEFSHSLCEACKYKLYKDEPWFKKST